MKIDLMKTASVMRKDLKFIIKSTEGGTWVFNDNIGLRLSPSEFQEFIAKWASYKGNSLPPFEKLYSEEEEVVLHWLDKWSTTEVNFKHLVSKPEVYQTVAPTALFLEAGKQRIIKTQAGDLQVVSTQYLNLFEGGSIITTGDNFYQVLNDSGNGPYVTFAGLHLDEPIEALLENILPSRGHEQL